VPVVLGGVAEGRQITGTSLRRGALVELIEHPAVSRTESRWLLHVMADHTDAQIDRLVHAAVEARELFRTSPPASGTMGGDGMDP